MTAGEYLFNMETCVGCDPEVVGDEARWLWRYVCGYPGYWEALYSDADMMYPGEAFWLYAYVPGLSIVPPLPLAP
jgi:hypothetical protein